MDDDNVARKHYGFIADYNELAKDQRMRSAP